MSLLYRRPVWIWVLLTVTISTFTLQLGCANTPNFERINDDSNPEAILWSWLSHEIWQVSVGFLEHWPVEACWEVEGLSFELNDEDAEEAFRTACSRLDAIYEKYGDIEEFWRWSNENPFVRPAWKELSNESPANSCCNKHLSHLLMWQDFTSEIHDTGTILRDDLVCGLGKEYYVNDDCRQRDSGPILTQSFSEAASAVEAYLRDSAIYHATRCEFRNCKEEYLREDKRNERLINHVLSVGKFEPLTTRYTRRGEWLVLLIAKWPDSDKPLLQCFRVFNKPGKFAIRKPFPESAQIIDVGYPWVGGCGGFVRIGEGFFKSEGSLQTRIMSDRKR